LSNFQANLNPGETAATISGSFAAGRSNLTLTTPGAGNEGSVDVSVDLSAVGTNRPWLQFDWDANGSHDNDPLGRATFGIYQGETRHIYLRELY
jgi:MSHA biogenesis protein MshQ